jgi:hypothetical protein
LFAENNAQWFVVAEIEKKSEMDCACAILASHLPVASLRAWTSESLFLDILKLFKYCCNGLNITMAGSLLRYSERRNGKMLGTKQLWPGDNPVDYYFYLACVDQLRTYDAFVCSLETTQRHIDSILLKSWAWAAELSQLH